MSGLAFGTLGVVLLILLPAALAAKGATVRITITGADLPAPIELSDPSALRPFDIWSGPGVIAGGVAQREGFIIDWAAGPVVEAPTGLPQFEVTFDARGQPAAYAVSYVYDHPSAQGYVYLPGRDDPRFRRNTRAIHRGLEGQWFLATDAWDAFIEPILARASR